MSWMMRSINLFTFRRVKGNLIIEFIHEHFFCLSVRMNALYSATFRAAVGKFRMKVFVCRLQLMFISNFKHHTHFAHKSLMLHALVGNRFESYANDILLSCTLDCSSSLLVSN